MNYQTLQGMNDRYSSGPDEAPENICPTCNDSGFLCDDCGMVLEDCNCKPYMIDGEMFYREIGKCECQR